MEDIAQQRRKLWVDVIFLKLSNGALTTSQAICSANNVLSEFDKHFLSSNRGAQEQRQEKMNEWIQLSRQSRKRYCCL